MLYLVLEIVVKSSYNYMVFPHEESITFAWLFRLLVYIPFRTLDLSHAFKTVVCER